MYKKGPYWLWVLQTVFSSFLHKDDTEFDKIYFLLLITLVNCSLSVNNLSKIKFLSSLEILDWAEANGKCNSPPPFLPPCNSLRRRCLGVCLHPIIWSKGERGREREREREREIKVENPWEIQRPLQTKNFHSKFVGLSFSSIKTIYWSLICNTACSQVIIRITLK